MRRDGVSNLESQLRLLSKRVEALEDEREIQSVMTRYALAVDSNDAEATSQIYAEDCTIDIDGDWFFNGREETKQIVTGDVHQSILPNCAHLMGPFAVRLKGNRATASGYATIFVRREGEVTIWRQSYQCWELVKRDGRWQALKRTSRSTGREDGQALLRAIL